MALKVIFKNVSCFLCGVCTRAFVCLLQDDRDAMLSYSFKVSLSLLQNRKFRRTVHDSLVKLYNELGVPDLISICQVLSASLVSSVMIDVMFYEQDLRSAEKS